MALFSSGITTQVVVTNTQNKLQSVILGVTLGKGESATLTGTALATFKAEYEKVGSSLKFLIDSGDLTAVETTDYDAADGSLADQQVPAVSAAPKKVYATFGAAGVTGVDANFTAEADQVAQVLNLGTLGGIVPAKSLILGGALVPLDDFDSGGTLAMDLGITSGGDEIIAAAAMEAVSGGAVASAQADVPIYVDAATNLYVEGTPGTQNWDQAATGKWAAIVWYV